MLDEAQARAAQAEVRQGAGDINTDDDDDDTAEYDQWHLREMARIARSALLCPSMWICNHVCLACTAAHGRQSALELGTGLESACCIASVAVLVQGAMLTAVQMSTGSSVKVQ